MKTIEYGKEHPEVLLLLHGGGLSWWNYRAEAERLADRYHVVLPILDGHAESGEAFVSLEANAERLLSLIDRDFGGSLLLLGGLSLGAQLALELLSMRPELCRFALIESASAIPSPLTHALIGPSFSASFGLIRQRWFSELQFHYLRIREELFDDYYRDTCRLTREDMIAFLQANTAYAPKESLRNCRAKVRIIVGEKESRQMQRSAELLHEMLPGSALEKKKGLAHGEYSLNCPELYVDELLAWLSG